MRNCALGAFEVYMFSSFPFLVLVNIFPTYACYHFNVLLRKLDGVNCTNNLESFLKILYLKGRFRERERENDFLPLIGSWLEQPELASSSYEF